MGRPSLLVTVFLAVCASANPLRRQGIAGVFPIPDAGIFYNRQTWDFSGLADYAALPRGLHASKYPVGDTHEFLPRNAFIQGGYLNLRVEGGQTDAPYRSGEVTTMTTNIKYASVRTTAILSETPGVCNGMFFFASDNQETDIEWLSDPQSTSNNGDRKLWFENQASDAGTEKSVMGVAPPDSPTTTEHEYRIDWLADRVRFYVDGQLTWETDQNVPNTPGPWVFNNWANGDPGWTAAPPVEEALFKIKKIEMFYNTA
ncbi:concanavalin A-like lectin/glucanase domain-containing protein [Colletotrichum cereale]|nr:concanavalin A-like lectin/glucanase domain-containing protein [Colletotrichum cereale]